MLDKRIDSQISEIRTLLRDNLSIRGKDLPTQLRKAGRLLPRRVRKDAKTLVEARGIIQNPKLARMVDQDKLNTAHRSVVDYLGTIDPSERRKDRILGFLGVIAFNVLLFGAAFVTWLVWTERV